MVGILTRQSSGLIFAESFESYSSGWAFSQNAPAGSASVSSSGHTGNAFRLITGGNWPVNAYVELQKTLDLSSGPNRILKGFRGPLSDTPTPPPAFVMYDDFLGSVIDSSLWTTGGATESGGQAHLAGNNYQLTSTALTIRVPVKVKARFQVAADASHGAFWDALKLDNNNFIEFTWSAGNPVHLFVKFQKSGSGDTVDLGAQDQNMHSWEVDWEATYADVYKDGALVHHHTTNIPADAAGYYMFFDASSASVDVDYVGTTDMTPPSSNAAIVANAYKHSLIIGTQTFWDIDENSDPGSADGGFYDSGWITPSITGSNTATIKLRNASATAYSVGPGRQHTFDDFVCMRDSIITIQGLLNGQKIELYNSAGTLLKTGPSSGGDVTLTGIDAYVKSASGLVGYFKVYDVDAATLLYTSSTLGIWGGDVYLWASQVAVIYAPAASYRIYTSSSPNTPKSQALTFTMKWRDSDNPISGKLITLSTSLGSVSPTSATTDANGKVTTTLTSGAVHGWAVVQTSWAGSGDTSPAKTFLEVAVYDAQEAGDPTKNYQLFVHGIEYKFSSGSYLKSVQFLPQQFDVELPEIQSAIDGALEVIIFRRGSKDFIGRIIKVKKTIDNKMMLHGLSNHFKFQRRVANRQYTDEPKNIINDLLTRYPAGVSAGTLGTYGSTLLMPFTYDTLRLAIQRILDATGWQVRLNLDDSLDFNVSFGVAQAITFQTGQQNVIADRETDYTDVATRTFLIGEPSTVVSDKDDATEEASIGLVERAFADKNLTSRATLDVENQSVLNRLKAPVERITFAAIDLGFDVAAYDVFDSVTVIDANAGLSGLYQVMSIKRDMLDKGYAEIELSNVQPQLHLLLSNTARTVKDLATS